MGKGELDIFLVKRGWVGEYMEVNFRNTIIAHFKNVENMVGSQFQNMVGSIPFNIFSVP